MPHPNFPEDMMTITIEVHGHAHTFTVTPKQLRKLAAYALRTKTLDALAGGPRPHTYEAVGNAFKQVAHNL